MDTVVESETLENTIFEGKEESLPEESAEMIDNKEKDCQKSEDMELEDKEKLDIKVESKEEKRSTEMLNLGKEETNTGNSSTTDLNSTKLVEKAENTTISSVEQEIGDLKPVEDISENKSSRKRRLDATVKIEMSTSPEQKLTLTATPIKTPQVKAPKIAKKAPGSSKRKKTDWTATEDEALIIAVLEAKKKKNDEESSDDEDWDDIAEAVPNKTAVQCLQRYMRHLNKKGGSGIAGGSNSATTSNNSYTPVKRSNENEMQQDQNENNNPNKMTSSQIASPLPTTPMNKIKPSSSVSFFARNFLVTLLYLSFMFILINRNSSLINPIQPWTPSDDYRLEDLRKTYGGSRWEEISSRMPGRSIEDVRTRWYDLARNKEDKKVHMTIDSKKEESKDDKGDNIDGESSTACTSSEKTETETETETEKEKEENKWSTEETGLLRKLVEQYQNGMFSYFPILNT